MNIIIDDITCDAVYGESILGTAKRNGIDIPHLCHNDALQGLGSCRLCIVELVEDEKTKVVASCLYPITRKLIVRTDSYRITRMRKTIMRLLLARSPENMQLNSMAQRYGLLPSKALKPVIKAEDCVLCGLCVKACEAIGANAIATVGRGTGKRVSTAYDEASEACIGCGACAHVCPTGAIEITESDGMRTIWKKSFELAKCKECGKHLESKEYIGFVEERLGSSHWPECCRECRQKLQALRFKATLHIY